MQDKPKIRCLFAWPLGDGDYYVRGDKRLDATCSLEEAEAYAELGFEIMTDPWTEEDLARWEQLNRVKDWRRGFGL